MFRFTRLVLAATVIGAVGVLSLPWEADGDALSGDPEAVSQVDWTNADKSDTWPPDGPTPGPGEDTDGDGIPDGEGDGPGGDRDGNGPGPSGEAATPDSGRIGGDDEERDRSESGGMLNLAFPVQAGMSVGLLALAFLALLPGRRMPADLR